MLCGHANHTQVYARLIENEDGTHDLIWSRSKPRQAD